MHSKHLFVTMLRFGENYFRGCYCLKYLLFLVLIVH